MKKKVKIVEQPVLIKQSDIMPEKVFFVDENGNFIDKAVSKKTTITKYWQEKTRLLGFLALCSCLLLLIILLGESNLIQNSINFLMGLLGALL